MIRALANLRRSLFAGLERRVAEASLVGDRPFFDPAQFGWTRELEQGHALIQSELAPMLERPASLPNFHDISPHQAVGTRDDLWKTWFFYCYGRRVKANCERCPQTERLLRRIPGMTTAFFSILMPGKEIGLHRGPYNGVLRYHLGLRTPRPASTCGITVGGRTEHWQTGKSLIFDDTYLHKAWNRSNDIRAILFVDFLRPLPVTVSLLNRLCVAYIAATPYVTTMIGRQKSWTSRLEAAYEKNS